MRLPPPGKWSLGRSEQLPAAPISDACGRRESFAICNSCQSSREPADLVLIAPHVDVERVRTDPDPYEPYRISQAMRVGDLLFVSGQAAIDVDGQLVGAGDFDAQAEQAFTNLQLVLEAGGSSMRDVVKVTIFLTDMTNFPKIVELRGKWFSEPYPADTIIQVVALALPELVIEIEAVAVVRGSR
jgi:2-iminobutanoate/2-iminopropanoate deaminase